MTTFRIIFRLCGAGMLMLMPAIICACATDIQTERTKLQFIDDKTGTANSSTADNANEPTKPTQK